jgi:Glycosyltransferase 61
LAWRSQKSALRKRLNGRWLRWKLWRGLFRLLPALGRSYCFPMTGAAATETASKIIENTTVALTGNFTPAQIENVVIPAIANDKVRVRHEPGTCELTRQVAIVPDCAVLGHLGVVARGRDGALLFSGAGAIPNWNYARPKRLKARRFGDGLVTSLQDTQHYYHFFERLLGLLGYLDRDHEPGAPLTVLVQAGGPAFQRSACAAIAAAYPGVAFVDLGRNERAEVARYLWLHELTDNTEWLPVTAERGARLASLLRSHYRQPEPRGGELLFFSRGEARKRRLLNEPELAAIAGALGFQRFEAVAGNHAEQVRRFGNADAIVAVHGAGLTNLLFARPGTAVIELFPENCVKSTYLWLSNRMQLRHYPLLGSAGDYHQGFRVDPGRFAARLDAVLGQAAQRRPTAA